MDLVVDMEAALVVDGFKLRKVGFKFLTTLNRLAGLQVNNPNTLVLD